MCQRMVDAECVHSAITDAQSEYAEGKKKQQKKLQYVFVFSRLILFCSFCRKSDFFV